MNMPPLETLRAFEAAARTGSISAAAERLNVTHGAVSRQIAKLETWLGARVFERQARGVALTQDGQRLFLRTSEAFALIANTTDRWRDPRGPAVVRLTSIPSVSGLWLMPRLAALERGPPPLRIVLDVNGHQVDLAEEGYDLSVRCGRGGIPGRVSLRLFEERCFPIASPSLVEAVGTGEPERLLHFPVIHDSDASAWRAWFSAFGIDYRPRPQDRRFEDYNLVLDAVAHGLGIGLARPPMTGAHLTAGRIARADGRDVANPVAYWMDRPASQPPRPAAADLARRIAKAAGVEPTAVEAFVEKQR